FWFKLFGGPDLWISSPRRSNRLRGDGRTVFGASGSQIHGLKERFAMAPVKEKVAVPPSKILGFMHAQWAVQALRAAVEINIFSHLEKDACDAAEVALNMDTDRRATETLLDALTGMALLTKKDGKYSLTEDARTYLLPSSDLFLGNYLKVNEQIDNAWKQL